MIFFFQNNWAKITYRVGVVKQKINSCKLLVKSTSDRFAACSEKPLPKYGKIYNAEFHIPLRHFQPHHN